MYGTSESIGSDYVIAAAIDIEKEVVPTLEHE